ncbi:hypothetical protein [Streptomyces ureilyticus]|jgi:hypothetical protein|uniref:Secreted protein n=1 Tax=Streptomyces ureilyticus TaxID=1775131 RepID=A0ABX0DNZ7_9ACTN|nr:hypothetical protein [Streptomyces ureilyticus]NGO41494.1 hypothetical protein [Streptomyces ureilyticus]
MKKRSMLAVASLAAGFVVAAVTPSHSLEGDALGKLDVQDTIGTLDKTADEGQAAVNPVVEDTQQQMG